MDSRVPRQQSAQPFCRLLAIQLAGGHRLARQKSVLAEERQTSGERRAFISVHERMIPSKIRVPPVTSFSIAATVGRLCEAAVLGKDFADSQSRPTTNSQFERVTGGAHKTDKPQPHPPGR